MRRRQSGRLNRFVDRHRLVTTVVVVVLVASPGYWRIEHIVSDVKANSETAEHAAEVAQIGADQAKATAEEARITAEIARAAAASAQEAIASAQAARDEARAVSCDEANVIAAKHNQLVSGFQDLLRTISAPNGQRSPEAQASIDEFARREIAKFEPIKIPARDCSAEGIARHFEGQS